MMVHTDHIDFVKKENGTYAMKREQPDVRAAFGKHKGKLMAGAAVIAAGMGIGYLFDRESHYAAQDAANAHAQMTAIIVEDQKQQDMDAAVAGAQMEALVTGNACNEDGSVGVKAEDDTCGMPIAVFDARQGSVTLRGSYKPNI